MLPTALLNRLPGPRNLLNRQCLPREFQQTPGHSHFSRGACSSDAMSRSSSSCFQTAGRCAAQVYACTWLGVVYLDARDLAVGWRGPTVGMIHQPQARSTLSVVVPCYDEAAVIRELHRRVTTVCRSLVGDSYELVLVNDGSRDKTWEILQMLAHCDDLVFAVDLSRNHGHQLALSAGLSLARGDRILVIDADLQDPPELLPHMMQLMDDGADVVYGQRVERDGETWFKKVSARTFYRLLLRMTDVPIPQDTGDFRLMSRRVVDALLAMPEYQRFIRGMVAWIGFRQVPLQYHRDKRFAGETKYSFGKMLTFALDAITG